MGQTATQPVASDVRYGLYLRPSLAMSRAQASLHDLLARQYGLHAAGRFPPHATLKGFFRATVNTAQLRARLTPMLAGRPAFTVFNRGVVVFGQDGIVLDVHRTPAGTPNAALQQLHEAALEALLPVVHEDCEFTWTDPGAGERFHAHLTLAFADIPAARFQEVLRFAREAEPIGPASFLADTVHLLAFTSDRWDGPWWESLRWRLLDSWQLGPAARRR
jgi:2'-5' RNA ligase